ncbi:MAG: PspA/IM30 family protein [Bryobacteraceae bacterium]
MALLERVTTLVKANINDLVSKAEHPEKLLQQLLLDMENQYMQVKTQVAIAIADEHLLETKQKDSLTAQGDWVRKAELALSKKDENLARTALERSLTYETAAHNFAQQIEDQAHQVEMLKTALHRLEQKMTETRTKAELMVARHRRAKLAARAGVGALEQVGQDARLRRIGDKVTSEEALGVGQLSVVEENTPEKRLEELERADRVDKLLNELKQKAG